MHGATTAQPQPTTSDVPAVAPEALGSATQSVAGTSRIPSCPACGRRHTRGSWVNPRRLVQTRVRTLTVSIPPLAHAWSRALSQWPQESRAPLGRSVRCAEPLGFPEAPLSAGGGNRLCQLLGGTYIACAVSLQAQPEGDYGVDAQQPAEEAGPAEAPILKDEKYRRWLGVWRDEFSGKKALHLMLQVRPLAT